MGTKKYYCTIIVISNKENVLEEYKKSLQIQKNVDYQLIVIDNTKNQYKSARKAFNSVLAQAYYEMVIFSHPDIRFMSENALFEILQMVEKINNFGVIGIAGCQAGKNWAILSNIIHGDEKREAGKKIEQAIEVQTVDECFFIMKKKIIQELKFTDEDGWHLYAVEQSLRMLDKGRKNYIVPAEIWHLSDGRSLEPAYMKGLEKIISKYRNNVEYINTTVKQWKTRGVEAYWYRKYYYMKQIMKKLIYR